MGSEKATRTEAVALFSGGKDSTLAIFKAIKEGFDVKCLISIVPASRESMMFHYPIEKVVSLQAEAMQLPLQLEHADTENEELMLLEDTLAHMKDGKNITTVVTGAIASTYQRDRVNKICEDLELEHFAPLWNMNQERVLHDLVKEKFEIIITSISAAGFDERWLGRKIDKECIRDLKILNEKCGINLSGEGGEYCTTVLDCPLFKKKLKVLDAEKKIKGNERGFYLIKDLTLESK